MPLFKRGDVVEHTDTSIYIINSVNSGYYVLVPIFENMQALKDKSVVRLGINHVDNYCTLKAHAHL